MAKESQYTDDYLRENARRGYGQGITPGTFIAYTVGGRARKYAGRYVTALINSVERRGAIRGRSKCNSTAYYTPATVRRHDEAVRRERDRQAAERMLQVARPTARQVGRADYDPLVY